MLIFRGVDEIPVLLLIVDEDKSPVDMENATLFFHGVSFLFRMLHAFSHFKIIPSQPFSRRYQLPYKLKLQVGAVVHNLRREEKAGCRKKPIVSMYGIFTYIYHKNQPNVGKYTIHGSYGKWISVCQLANHRVIFSSWPLPSLKLTASLHLKMDGCTPPKINIEPENGGLEDVSPFPGVHFQVPCLFWGV